MTTGDKMKSNREVRAGARAARLEAALKSNLKKRKEQARTRTSADVSGAGKADQGRRSQPSGEDNKG